MKVSVHHWRYEDGITPVNPGNQFGEMVPPRGWYCWAYPDNNHEFEQWMADNCPTADCTHRFNSGDPMYTVYISDESECFIFKITWAG